MKNLDKSVLVEVLGGLEQFKVVYTMAEIRKMDVRYIGSDAETDLSIYEVQTTGEIIAVEG
ncbi:MAG: hypothetical protein NHB14_20630 [Desulfosporosinus sp.]|nr:hypothetical protein [Desulfosporosinus sp.]